MISVDTVISRINSGPLFKHFERDYSLFFISTWGKSHNEILNSPKYGDGAITLNLDVYANNICQYYRLVADNEKLVNVITDKIIADSNLRENIFQNYSRYGGVMLALFEEIKHKPTINADFVQRLASAATNLVGYQILIIHRTDSYEVKFKSHPEIPQEIYYLRKKYESAFGLFETHFEMVCQQLLEERKNVTLQQLKLLNADEFIDFVSSNRLPTNLEERKDLVIVSHIPTTEYFFGKAAQPIAKAIQDNEKIFQKQQLESAILKGRTVWGRGKVIGICQVITNYDEIQNLKEGSILITPSTLPKYNHIYPRAKAIVTDEGGVLAHAAILCRESKIPGIIGTKVATKILRDGFNIELSLDRGVVRVL